MASHPRKEPRLRGRVTSQQEMAQLMIVYGVGFIALCHWNGTVARRRVEELEQRLPAAQNGL